MNQACPSCARAHDVSGYESGHRVTCACGASFEVRQEPDLGREDTGLEATMLGPSRPWGGSTGEREYEEASVLGDVELPGLELVRVLGRGGMGEVWLARQSSLGRMVAVKVLPPRLAKDAEFVTRFEKEATALAALNHPNIIQIIDRGVAGEHYYFVMEYVEGRSLRDVMRELSPPEILRVALQVARAIECAHDKEIIHRDLKPENILLDGRGHVKVADFGLAGIRQPDSRLQLTATAVAMGTLNYMAPEQRRDARSVDGRADLFSFGVVLYELLTGELPVGRFKPPSVKVPGLDARVDEVVERLLENEPESRYARASEVCHELEALVSASSQPRLSALSEGASEGGWGPRMRAGWSKARTPLAVVGGVGLLAFGGLALMAPVTRTKSWPANTNTDLFAFSSFQEGQDGRALLEVDFSPGEEEINAHAGTWKVVDGQLRAEQGGNDATGGRGKLIPRAYLARRYFAAADFSAEVRMDVRPLGPEYPPQPEDAQHYGELAFRVKNLQVSVFAIPDAGMRLSWRYVTEDGEDVVGNSAQDVEALVEDETPVPTNGPFRVKLQMKQRKNGVEVEAFVNGQRFARKHLVGLHGKVAKVAMGCRNLACTFEGLRVRGIPQEKPRRQLAADGAQD